MIKYSMYTVRQRLEDNIPTDAEYDAFVLDCFPDVFRKYSTGMCRTQKINLLFQYVNQEHIETQLNRNYGLGIRKRNIIVRCRVQIWLGLVMLCAAISIGWKLHNTAMQKERTQELIGVMTHRANIVISKIDKACKAEIIPECEIQKSAFLQLHNKHIEALREGYQIQAHELVNEIHQLLIEIEKTGKPKTDRVSPFFLGSYELTTKSYLMILTQPQEKKIAPDLAQIRAAQFLRAFETTNSFSDKPYENELKNLYAIYFPERLRIVRAEN